MTIAFRKYSFFFFSAIIIIISGINSLYAQADSSFTGDIKETADSSAEQISAENIKSFTDTARTHSVAKATWFSAALPGLGQAYNKKYWKIPIIYAALGGLTYLIIDNNYYYHYYLDGFYQINETPEDDLFLGVYDERQLIELQNIYRKWRDLSIIVAGVVYALNILDAHVDAHLFYYNLDDDLTLHWEPSIIRGPAYSSAFGVSFKVNF